MTAAQETANTAMGRTTVALDAPAQGRVSAVADFRRLHPPTFSGVEGPLQAEQWLVDTEMLLEVANIAEVDKV